MASETDPIAPRTWVAIDIAKGVNVALVEYSDGRQQRFRFVHQRDDYDRLVSFLRACPGPCRIALEPTADYHRTVAYRLVSEGFDLKLVSSVAGVNAGRKLLICAIYARHPQLVHDFASRCCRRRVPG